MNFSFKKPEDSPGFLLWRLSNGWQQKQRKALSALDLTHPQFVVLAGVLWLSHQSKDIVTQQQVSLLTEIDKMTMSDVVVALVKKNFLNRDDHHLDKRAYSLSLTELGRERVLQAIPIVEGIDAEFFSTKTEGLKQLVQILKSRGV